MSDVGPVRPGDARLVLPAVATWAAAWAAGVPGWSVRGAVIGAVVLVLGAVLSCLAAARWTRFPGGRRTGAGILAACLVCATGGWSAGSLRIAAAGAGPVPGLAADRAVLSAEARIAGDPWRLPAATGGRPVGADRWAVRLLLHQVTARGSRVSVRTGVIATLPESSRVEPLIPSVRVSLTGRLRPPIRPGGPAGLTVTHLHVVEGPDRLQAVAASLRAGLREAVAGLRAEERGLVPGLVVGDDSALPEEVAEDFRTAGLTHLTAVSGANCAIVLGFVLGIGRVLRLPRRFDPPLGLLTLAGFVVLARPEPSVLRAAVMGTLALIALATSRERPALGALAATVIVLILVDPMLARSYGFALSVLATGGIVVLAPRLLRGSLRRVPTVVAAPLAVSWAAYVACAPVLILMTPQVGLLSVPANLLAAPFVAPATILGFAATLIAPCSSVLAGMLGELAGMPARALVVIAGACASVPHATVPWRPGIGGSLLLLALLLAVVRLGRRLMRPAVVAAAAGGGAVLALPPPPLVGWPPLHWLVVACSVGQGDALVLNAGAGSAVVVDAGPDPAAVDGCLRRLGVRRVPLLVLSHYHADHVDGLPGVLRHRQVGGIAVGPLDEPPAQARQVRAWAAAAGVPTIRLPLGETRTVGPLSLRSLWPERILRGEESAPNNASVVLDVGIAGRRLLLLGDVEPAAQRALLPRVSAPVDVLKVAHHGSAHQNARLVERLRPRVALISVGAGNRYGHPAPSTVGLLRSAGGVVLRTDTGGDLAVSDGGDRLRTWSRGPPPAS